MVAVRPGQAPRAAPGVSLEPGRFSLASSGRSAHDATPRMLSARGVCVIPAAIDAFARAVPHGDRHTTPNLAQMGPVIVRLSGLNIHSCYAEAGFQGCVGDREASIKGRLWLRNALSIEGAFRESGLPRGASHMSGDEGATTLWLGASLRPGSRCKAWPWTFRTSFGAHCAAI